MALAALPAQTSSLAARQGNRVIGQMPRLRQASPQSKIVDGRFGAQSHRGIGTLSNRSTAVSSGPARPDSTNTSTANVAGVGSEIGDLVWEDVNANGVQDSGEPGIDGVVVHLRNSDGDQIDSTTTAGGGLYSFANQADGSYSLEFVKPAGYVFTSKEQGGNATTDSDADASGHTAQFIVTDDVFDSTRDAGLIGTYVGDKVFGDTNGNGVQDNNEIGISGVTVRLLNSSNAVVATTTTQTDGAYKFFINASGNYSVEFVAPAGYILSPQDQGTDDTRDSDANDIPNEVLPQTWAQEISANNPVVPLGTGDSATVDEQYQPTVIRVANGDIWIYVKGTGRLYAFKSTDDGETFTIQNGGLPVLEPGSAGRWDDGFVLDPSAVYDRLTDTIHLYYKGGHYNLSEVIANYQSTSWGHATASGSAPTVFTKDPSPILTSPTAVAALGASDFIDMRLDSVIRIGSTFYFYGHIITGTAYLNGNDFKGRLFYATGSTWTNPIVQGYAFPNNSDNMINNGWVQMDPMVFKQPGSPIYTMLYAEGSFFQGQPGASRSIKVATSRDAKVWKLSAGTFLTSSTTGDGWDAKMVYGPTILKKSIGSFIEPELVNGKFLIYFSGLNEAIQAASGLVRVVPASPPDPATGRTAQFTVLLGQTDNTRDAGMYAASTGSFQECSTSGLTLSDSSSSPSASPYPSEISVGGLSGIITRLTVTINGFSDPAPDSIDMLLVGPAGQTFILWSDVGSTPGAPVNITLDDAAPARLPLIGPLGSGTFKPTNEGTANDPFSSPAPVGTYGNPGPAGGGTATLASRFNGTNPNGTWKLYALDDSPANGAAGSITSWCLNITVSLPADAINDSFATNEGTNLSGNVLANDIGSPLTVTAIGGCADPTAPFNCTTSQGGALTMNADGSFVYTPPANPNGSDSFTYTASNISGSDAATAAISVASVADTPTITNTTTAEDTQTASGLVIVRNVTDGSEITHFKILEITNGTLFKSNGTTKISNGEYITVAEGNAGLKFTPAANLFSPTNQFGFIAQAALTNADTGLGGSAATATITVNPVPEVPSVTNATTREDTQTTSGLVIIRSPIDGAEVTRFKITGITGGTLFKNDGTTKINNGDFITLAEGGAGLKFSPSANLFSSPGSFSGFFVAAAISSEGGLGPTAIASVTVDSVADTPIVANATTDENTPTGPVLYVGRNPGDAAEVTHFKITAITNGTLFENDGITQIKNGDFVSAGEGAIGFRFVPAANLFSPSSSFSFTAQSSLNNSDAGLGGSPATAIITVNGLAQTPSVTNATTNEDTQSTSGLVVSRNSVDGAEVTHFKITNIINGKLFKNDGITRINEGNFITVAEGNAGLRFTPATNLFSPSTSFGFQVQGATSAAGAGLSSGLATASITVNSANDAPSFTRGPDQNVNKDPGAQTIDNWATNISAGPADESGQTLTFLVSNDNNAIFSAQPSISPSGTLTYTRAAALSGVANVTVRVMDNGGTANGGNDTSAPQTFTISNLAPAILTVEGTDRAIGLDSVTLTRDPLSLLSDLNFSSDHRTRIALFALNTQLEPDENASAVTAEAEVSGTVFQLIVESVRPVPNFDWLTQVVVKFPEQFSTGAAGAVDVKVRIRLRGANSNQAVVTIVPVPTP